MDFNENDERFQAFAISLEKIMGDHGENTTERQRDQIETLVKLEKEFRKTLIRHRWGIYVYRDFIGHIMDTRRNILEARPFFRERNDTFTNKISDVFRKRNARGLFKFHVNYNFIRFVMDSRKWSKNSQIAKIKDKIVAARKELVEMNMKLAIGQANTFYGKMPKAHLTRMDFIQIAAEGLIAAIDKFCLPYTTVFRTVATHRSKGNMIESISETPIHFYPKDKRRLYRAHKFIRAQQGKNYSMEELVKYVNIHVKPHERTNVAEMINLLGAVSMVSANSVPAGHGEEPEGEPVTILDRYLDKEAPSADQQIENMETRHIFMAAIKELDLFEQKLLMMKGIEI